MMLKCSMYQYFLKMNELFGLDYAYLSPDDYSEIHDHIVESGMEYCSGDDWIRPANKRFSFNRSEDTPDMSESGKEFSN